MATNKRKASSELQLNPSLADFPKELLIEIFDYFNKEDLLNLTLVCRKFNDIISDRFIDKLSVWFNKRKFEEQFGKKSDDEENEYSWNSEESDSSTSSSEINNDLHLIRNYTHVHFEGIDYKFAAYAIFSTVLIKEPKLVKTLSFNEYTKVKEYYSARLANPPPYPTRICSTARKSTGGGGKERLIARFINEIDRKDSFDVICLLTVFSEVQTLHMPNLFSFIDVPNDLQKFSVKKLHVPHQFLIDPANFDSSIEEILIKKNDRYCYEILENLLLAQEALTLMTLDLRDFVLRRQSERLTLPLFNSNALDEVKFRLKSLTLFNSDELTENENYCNFIKNHAESLRNLKIFELYDVSILNNFESFKMLKNVVLSFKPETIGDYSLNVQSNIESLEMSLQNSKLIKNFDQKFPNLKRLKLSKVDGDIEVGGCNKLEHLSIEKSSSEIFNIPSNVKHLEIIDHTFKAPPEFIKPIGIKNLILKKCENVEWLQNLIEEESIGLDYLEIERIELQCNFIQTFADNRSKIKVFRSNNVQFV